MGAVHKILIVEDDSAVSAAVERVLAKRGMAVVTVANGAEALKMVAAEDFAAVFADIAAPGLSGLEVAAQVRAQQPWMPVVIIAGGGADDGRAQAAGAICVLHKPVSEDEIEQAARLVLESAPALAAHAETAPASKAAGGIGSLIAGAFIALFTAIAAPAVAIGGWMYLGLEEATRAEGPVTGRTAVARIFLFFISPFIAAFYMGVMPMIGMMELMKLGAEEERRAGMPPRKGPFGMVSHLLAGGRAWIAAGPGH